MDTKSYTLYFLTSTAQVLDHPYIRIRATGSPGWNDFLYNFQALIEIEAGDGRESFKAPAYVMPISDEKSAKRLNTWLASAEFPLDQNNLGFISAPLNKDGVPLFISLFDGHTFYRELNQWSKSQEERYAILGLINDVVFLRNTPVFSREVLTEFMLRNSFALGVLRTSSTYRAVRRGWRSLQAQALEELPDARSDLKFSAQLDGFDGSRHQLHVSYIDSELFEDRVHCLIGVNGTGKTRLLRELALTLSQRFATIEGASVFCGDDVTEANSPNEYNGLSYNRVLVFSAAGELRFPSTTRNDTAFEYQYFNLASDDLLNIGRLDSEKRSDRSQHTTMASVVVDILRDREIFSSKFDLDGTRFDLLQRAINSYIEMDSIYLPLIPGTGPTASWVVQSAEGGNWVKALDLIKMNEQRRLELTAMIDEEAELGFFKEAEEGNRIRRMHLSSGQQMFFKFALRFISTIDTGTLVLIDEPETHLHPNLICDFVTLLYEVLVSTKSVALIATHSAYIVREVPTHCVHVFSFEDDSSRIDVGKVRLKTLGASVDSISQAVFGDATAMKYHEKLAQEIASGKMSASEILDKYQSVLSPELLIQIRADMEETEEESGDDQEET